MNVNRGMLVLLGLVWAGPAAAQQVRFQGLVAADTAVQRTGPNRAYFSHVYISYLPILAAGAAAAPVRPFSSGELQLGWRQKWRLNQVLAFGLGTQYSRLNYQLAQQAGKTVPTPARYDRESLSWQQLQLAPFLRLNAGRRGNVVGHYLDIGGWGGWAFGTTHTAKTSPGTPARVVRLTERGLPYAARWTYGTSVRVGTSRYALEARRRFSPLWRGAAAAGWAELPRWSVGLELGLL